MEKVNQNIIESGRRLLSDKAWARWTALALVASMMLFAYMFVDVMSPLQSLIQTQRGWSPDAFGYYAGAEYILNVFGFLILAGIILDKMGVRFTGTLSASLMVGGALIKLYAISENFQGSGLDQWLNSWWTDMPGSAKLAALGFMIFGCGCEMAGITVSKTLAKWFEGKEMALAMGLEMAIARIGVFFIFTISPRLADSVTPHSVVVPVAFCTALLCIGLLCFIVFTFMDAKLDREMGASANMLQCNLGITETQASDIFRWFPVGAAILTPFLGYFLDRKGKGASMLILGAILMIVCHLTFAFVVPSTKSELITYSAIVVLGVSFSLVPAALWPSVPKIMDKRFLGSAYSLIFWVQNIGLAFVPIIIGKVITWSNPGVTDPLQYNYTIPMCCFASLGVLALIFGVILKSMNAKHHYGLEDPNIKEDFEDVRLDGEA